MAGFLAYMAPGIILIAIGYLLFFLFNERVAGGYFLLLIIMMVMFNLR